MATHGAGSCYVYMPLPVHDLFINAHLTMPNLFTDSQSPAKANYLAVYTGMQKLFVKLTGA